MQETEVTSSRHEIDDLDHLEFLASQSHKLTHFWLLIFIDDRPGVIATLHDVANFVYHRYLLAPNEMLMAKLERKIRSHIAHDDIS